MNIYKQDGSLNKLSIILGIVDGKTRFIVSALIK